MYIQQTYDVVVSLTLNVDPRTNQTSQIHNQNAMKAKLFICAYTLNFTLSISK